MFEKTFQVFEKAMAAATVNQFTGETTSYLYVALQFFEKTRVAVKAGEGFGQVCGQVLIGTWL